MAQTATPRLLPALALCLMGCTTLSHSAQAGLFDHDTKADQPAAPRAAVNTGAGLDSAIRQAQLQRVAGQYDDAVKTLSQLMLVAADDGRVVAEYGKTLTAMGRAQEAMGFLTRAQQLQAGDWTLYNALGVAYDQLDKQAEARGAYEHALTLKPGDATVLNNYALSRMLAKDPAGARDLIARAESAGGTTDPQIARNIAMIHDLAPASAAPVQAVATVTPPPVAAPQIPEQAPPPPHAPESRVVMQRVPVDPLAGPVPAATRTPRPLQKAVAHAETKSKPVAKNTAPALRTATDAHAAPPALRMSANSY